MSRLLALRQQRAFERIYRRHVSDVYRYALAVLRDPDDAEQVTRTTFLNAYRGVERPQKGHLNWLLGIAHDVCRRRVGHHRIEEGASTLDEEPTADDLRRALVRLPFDQREVLVLREVEGRSYGEIAQLLEIPVETVGTLIFCARRSLREHVEGALTCRETELAVSRDLDEQASRRERRLLRAHVRSCLKCGVYARDQHVQRAALRQLAAVELPTSLDEFAGPRRTTQVSSARGIS